MRYYTTKRPSCNGHSHNNWPASAQQLKAQHIRAIEKRDATGRGRWRTFRRQILWWPVSLDWLDARQQEHGVGVLDPIARVPCREDHAWAELVVIHGTNAAIAAFADELIQHVAGGAWLIRNEDDENNRFLCVYRPLTEQGGRQ